MARTGPKPKPVEILQARGSREPRTKIKELASIPDMTPVPRGDYPPNLKPIARPYYDGICGHLETIKRLRSAYVPAMVELANLMTDMDRLRFNENRLDEPGLELSAKDRILLESRLILQKDNIGKAMLRLQREFYMTPAAMEGVAVAKDPPKPVENQPAKAALRGRK